MLTDTPTFPNVDLPPKPKTNSQLDARLLPPPENPPARPRLHIIAPALPPLLDGIGDYTAHLAKELSSTLSVTILSDSRGGADPIPGVKIAPTFDPNRRRSVWNIADAVLCDMPDAILLQYNPFAYGRWGLNLSLPRVLKCIRQHAPTIPIVIMMHEIYVPLTNWKFAIMATWQRWQFRQLGRASDAVCFSIQPWTDQRRTHFCLGDVYHLPVGSNIPREPVGRAEARARLGLEDDELALGVFGTAHVSRMLQPLRSSADAVSSETGRAVRLVYIGPHADIVRDALGDLPLIADGPHSPAEVSRRLSALDIFLATYADGVSTRRGAMMAALQHSIAVVGTRGHHTDAELIEADGSSLLLASAGDLDEFDAAVVRLASDAALRHQIGAGGFAMFNRRYSWPAIASSLIDILWRTKPVDHP